MDFSDWLHWYFAPSEVLYAGASILAVGIALVLSWLLCLLYIKADNIFWGWFFLRWILPFIGGICIIFGAGWILFHI